MSTTPRFVTLLLEFFFLDLRKDPMYCVYGRLWKVFFWRLERNDTEICSGHVAWNCILFVWRKHIIIFISFYLVDRASFSNSFYFFTNLIHLVFFTIIAYLSLHVSDQSVHYQEDQMLNYTSSFWRRSLGRWSVVVGRWC